MILKKIVVFLIISLVFTFFIIATSDKLFSHWNTLPFVANFGVRGDLYSLTYLRQFKEYDYLTASTLPQPNYKKSDIIRDTHLYLIGDSFIKGIGTDQYISAKTTFVRVGVESMKIDLDTSKINVLIIQNIERGICDRFGDDVYERTFMGISGYYTEDVVKNIPNQDSEKPELLKDFKVGDIEDRLQHIAFGYSIFGLVKEAKAALNFYFFDRITGHHVVSKDKKYLFYHNEADQYVGLTSSFAVLKDEKIKEYAYNAEKITKFYKKMGFDSVWFVFVPNKVSISAPNDGVYNHQIERLQHQQTDFFKAIDVYSDMFGKPQLYHKGDGHWNKNGMSLFVKKVNDCLKNHESR